MLKAERRRVVAAVVGVLGLGTIATVAEAGNKPNTMEPCKVCHQPAEQTVRGRLVTVSENFKSVSVTVGPLVWIVKYGDDLKVREGAKISGPEALKSIPRDKEILVAYTGDETKPVATQLAVKQPYKVPEGQVILIEEVKKQIEAGPEKGGYTLVDSRPPALYLEGHLPNAKSLPFAAFKDKYVGVLPEDKGALILFYCAGETCVLSPFSAREAERLGYTNVKVFTAGLPGWKKAGGLVLLEAAAIESWIKNADTYVLIDLRDPEVARNGFIPGAVNVPAKDLASWKERFPKNQKAPIVLYDAAQASPEAFATVRGWGYVNTSVLRDGIASWKGELKTGPLGAEIVYVKQLKPGQIGIEEFKGVVEKTPGDKFILDVRGGGSPGVFPGAKVIAQDQLAGSLGEVPKDKEIIIHCNTGILAKMAHQTLAENGFKSRYLDAVVQVAENGAYEITEK